MAKAKKLKVFRTPIGFHDAYVAAQSQKAALEAWGSDSNLFAAGVAEVVTDPALTKEPLERPGEVVRVLRGSAAEQVRALGRSTVKKKTSTAATGGLPRERSGSKKGKRPSRAAVEKAEAALDGAAERHRTALAKLRAEEQALERRRRDLERKQRGERDRLAREVEAARVQYRASMAEWAES